MTGTIGPIAVNTTVSADATHQQHQAGLMIYGKWPQWDVATRYVTEKMILTQSAKGKNATQPRIFNRVTGVTKFEYPDSLSDGEGWWWWVMVVVAVVSWCEQNALSEVFLKKWSNGSAHGKARCVCLTSHVGERLVIFLGAPSS